MLKVRLQRVGKKHEPVFRVVVTDSHAGPKAGKAVEVVGSYDPRFNKATIKKERIEHWMNVGAQVSPTVHNLLVTEKVIDGKKINVLPKKAPIKTEGEADAKAAESNAPEAATPTEEAPAEAPVVEAEKPAEAPAEASPEPEKVEETTTETAEAPAEETKTTE